VLNVSTAPATTGSRCATALLTLNRENTRFHTGPLHLLYNGVRLVSGGRGTVLRYDDELEFGCAPDFERTTDNPFRAHAYFRLAMAQCTPLGQRSPLVQMSAPIPLAAQLAPSQGPSALPNPSTSEELMPPPPKRSCLESISVDGLLSRAEELGIDAAWLCEYGSPNTASFLSFLVEALTHFQRGFPPIPAHCLTRPLVASGNDKTSAPAMNALAELIRLRIDGDLVKLRKSVLTAKTTFVPQEKAFSAVLRTVPYTTKEEAEEQMKEADDSGGAQQTAPHLLLMHRFLQCNMIGDPIRPTRDLASAQGLRSISSESLSFRVASLTCLTSLAHTRMVSMLRWRSARHSDMQSFTAMCHASSCFRWFRKR